MEDAVRLTSLLKAIQALEDAAEVGVHRVTVAELEGSLGQDPETRRAEREVVEVRAVRREQFAEVPGDLGRPRSRERSLERGDGCIKSLHRG